jgi:D-3-phosphoglycerate dehydrogenase
MIILNAESKDYSAAAEAILRGLGELRSHDLDQSGLLREVGDIDVLIVRLANRIDAEMLSKAPKLRVIVSATTGLDHIDLEAAARGGVAVLSLRGETAFLSDVSATAEHAWALLLALMRKLPQAAESVRAGAWDRDSFRGQELAGRRLGIVGLGRLGTKVGRYGIAFGMNVAAFDPHRLDWPHGISRSATLAELLVGTDVLSLHAPLNRETRGMIGAVEIASMPKDSVLINTARGELLDERALLDALSTRHLAAAALDVIGAERDHRCGTQPSPLVGWSRQFPDRLLITPHIGGATLESMAKTELFMAHKLANFLATSRSQSSLVSRRQ